MAERGEIETYLNSLLAIDRFKDYGPNGLQVEGAHEVLRAARRWLLPPREAGANSAMGAR